MISRLCHPPFISTFDLCPFLLVFWLLFIETVSPEERVCLQCHLWLLPGGWSGFKNSLPVFWKKKAYLCLFFLLSPLFDIPFKQMGPLTKGRRQKDRRKKRKRGKEETSEASSSLLNKTCSPHTGIQGPSRPWSMFLKYYLEVFSKQLNLHIDIPQTDIAFEARPSCASF